MNDKDVSVFNDVEEEKAARKAAPKRLADYGTIDRSRLNGGIDDVLGRELTLTDGEVQHGNYGEYVVVSACMNNGQEVTFATGAFLVVDAIKDLLENGDFPVKAKFSKRGRTYRFD